MIPHHVSPTPLVVPKPRERNERLDRSTQ